MFSKNHFVWHEPWFFSMRTRSARGWLFFLTIAFIVAVGVAVLLLFVAPKQPDLLHVLMWSAAAGGVVLVWLEGNLARRSCVLHQDGLTVSGDFGQYTIEQSYPIKEIRGVRLFDAESTQKNYQLAVIWHGDDLIDIGIEPTVSLPRLAQAFHDAGVQDLGLEGWSPGTASEFEQVFAFEAANAVDMPPARVDPVLPDEAKLYNAVGILKTALVQLWPFLLWLIGVVAFGWYAWSNWQTMGSLPFWSGIAAAVIMFMLSIYYYEVIGGAWGSKILVAGCRDQINTRPNAILDGRDEAGVAVEVLERAQFATAIQKIKDMGLLLVDAQRQEVLFEGKEERWRIPFASVQSCKIEEIQVGTAGETAFGALAYFVVMSFQTMEGIQEVGFRDGDREYGKITDVTRAEDAVRIYQRIVDPLESLPA